jgi:ribosomal subunit interface protein
MYNIGMNINIKTSSISLTPSISDYVDKRLQTIKSFFQNDSTAICDVELARTTFHHKSGDIFRAEIHIVAKDKNLYASNEQDDLYKAIDMVRDEMLREIKTTKSKDQSMLRRGGARIKDMIRGIWKGKK